MTRGAIDALVVVVAALLVAWVVAYVYSALVRRRAQKLGLFWAVLALPLFALYYNDRPPFGGVSPDRLVQLPTVLGKDPKLDFPSLVAPAAIVLILMFMRLAVSLRISVRIAGDPELRQAGDLAGNFLAGTVVAALLAGFLVSAYDLGLAGAFGVGALSLLIYLLTAVAVFVSLQLIVQAVGLVLSLARLAMIAVGGWLVGAVIWFGALPQYVPDRLKRWIEQRDEQIRIAIGEELRKGNSRILTIFRRRRGSASRRPPEQSAPPG